jgi:hypothetical protein
MQITKTTNVLPQHSFDIEISELSLVQYETINKVYSLAVGKLRSLCVANASLSNVKIGQNLDLEKTEKLISELDLVDISKLSLNLKGNERSLFDNFFSKISEEVLKWVAENPLLKPVFTLKRVKKLVALDLVPATKVLSEKMEKIAPYYFRNIESFELITKDLFEQSQKMDDFSQKEFQEIYEKMQPKSIGKLDAEKFTPPHFEIVQKIAQILRKQLEKDKTVGDALIVGFLFGVAKCLKTESEKGTSQK